MDYATTAAKEGLADSLRWRGGCVLGVWSSGKGREGKGERREGKVEGIEKRLYRRKKERGKGRDGGRK